MPEQNKSTIRVGWREWASLPEFDVPWIKAKIDTGARTSSLHAYDVEVFERDGQEWVRFDIRPWQEADDRVRAEAPVHDHRQVRSSNGHVEDRFVVRTRLSICGRQVTGEITLTDRDEMGFRMLVGREVLEQEFLVDSSESYLGGRPKVAVRRQNRGR